MSDAHTDRLGEALADRYRIERELGQGGMATVYLAADIKHDRKVAVKVLRPELAAVLGADRFVQEIKTTASLQHPHILPLHDSGEADGFLFYVMPYIEGETLRDKLDRETQLSIDEAVRITTDVADALDYAHRNGVIHRDIKPENILLHDGRPTVADFGIALALSAAAGGRMTETGLSLGTPHYMSPEQATAEKDITARSDIYSLASVLYEMLTGQPPHLGGSAQQIIMKIVTDAARPVTELRKSVPPNVAAAAARALEKLPADRFESAKAFAGALHDPRFRHGTAAGEGAPTAARGRRSRDPAFLGMAGIALIGIAAALWGWQRARTATAALPEVYDIALPDSAAMDFAGYTPSTPFGSSLRGLSVAPSGDVAVYVVKQGTSTILWRHSLRDTTAAPIPGSEGASAPRISPDGTRLAFVARAGVVTVPLAGGQPRAIADLDGDPFSLDWISPTTLLVTDQAGLRLRRIDPDAGTFDSRAVPLCFDCSWIPDDRQMLGSMRGVAVVIDPTTGEVWPVKTRTAEERSSSPLAGWSVRLVGGRYLVYQTPQGELRAAPYDRSTHTVGRSASLLTGIRASGIGSHYDVSRTGTLVFAPGGNAHIGQLVERSAGGAEKPLPVPPDAYQRWDMSRDGRWLAAVVSGPGYEELRVSDLRGGQSFTWLRASIVDQPLWGPDNSTLLVGVQDSAGAAIVLGSPSSGGSPDTAFVSSNPAAVPLLQDWSGPHQALGRLGSPYQVVRFDPLARPVRFDTIISSSTYAMTSPDARYIVVSRAAESRVLITANPPGSWEHQLATSAVEPVWLSSSEILYRSGSTWHAVRIDPGTGQPVGTTTVWGADPRFSDTFGWSNRPNWRGGIIYLQGPEDTRATYLRVIPRWVERMQRAVDEANR